MSNLTSTGERAVHSGTVFDIGYQRYAGVREGRDRAMRAIVKDGIRTALGLGRGGRAKVLPWFFISLLVGIALIFALVVGAAERMLGQAAADQSNLPSLADYYGFASIIIFVFAAVVGPEMLSPDRRNRVITLYLVRPITGSDYIIARWTAFFAVMAGALWLPQVILFAASTMDDPAPLEYFRKHWIDVPRFLVTGGAMAAYATTLALLAASFTTRRAYASVFLVGLFIITTPFTVGLAEELKGAPGQWLSMFNLTNIPVHVNDIVFDEVTELTEDAPARKLGSTILVAWYFLWTVLPASILWWRYRRLSP
jgi:ABC-2 type transport system permease protein